jgi:5-methylcytosine-specific restriction endonuclease McrA
MTKPQQRKFVKRSLSIVRNLNARLRKLRHSQRVSLEDARKAMLAAIGTRCCYCEETITPSNMSLDHPTPLSRGGSPTVLEVCCLKSNREKGELTSDEFRRFLCIIQGFSDEAQREIHRKMRAGGAFFRMQARLRKVV